MKLALGPYIRFSRILLFPLAMVIYDFSAYLTTDLIQPGIIHIIREFEADVALAPASVSLYLAGGSGITVAAGAALRPHWSPPRTTDRSHHLCFGLLQHDLCHVD